MLDRVDDDTHELGTLLRRIGWDLVRTLLRAGPMWVVAGLTWWPAWVLFPLVGVATVLVVRPLTAEVARRKLAEEIAWTDSRRRDGGGRRRARRPARRASARPTCCGAAPSCRPSCTRRVAATCVTASADRPPRRRCCCTGCSPSPPSPASRSSSRGGLSTAELVTLFLVTTTFVGQIDQISRAPARPAGRASARSPACARCSTPSPSRPAGGPVPAGPLSAVSVRGLRFSYHEGAFALRDVDLELPAGQTLALVGRTGSGKSTLAALALARRRPAAAARCCSAASTCSTSTCRRCARAVGVVTQRTEVLAGTLAENITLFADVPARRRREAPSRTLGLADWVAALPDGLDTVLGPGGTTLSAGRGAARRLRPAARARRAGRRARRGDRADGPGHRGAGRPGGRAAARRPHRARHRAPARDHRAGRAGRGARGRPRRAAGPAGAAWPPGPGRSATCSRAAGRAERGRRRPTADGPLGHGGRRAGEARRAAGGRHGPEPGAQHRRDAAHAPPLGARRRRRCSCSSSLRRRLRRAHRLAVGPRRRVAAGRRPAGRGDGRASPACLLAAPRAPRRAPSASTRGGGSRCMLRVRLPVAARADDAAPAAAHARPARSSAARWTPTASPATPTAGSTSSTALRHRRCSPPSPAAACSPAACCWP